MDTTNMGTCRTCRKPITTSTGRWSADACWSCGMGRAVDNLPAPKMRTRVNGKPAVR